MNRRFVSIMLLLTLVAGLLCAPAGLAESRFTASTPLAEASSNNIKNIQRAAASINGRRLEAGQSFSFNETVGPRTKAQGYVTGKNGRGAKVTGGGVAQVASVLWLAVKDMDDISIVEKSTYGSKYNQSYVDSSSDAILTDYSAGRDFSFRYTGDGSITIYTYMQDKWLYCDIYAN